MTSRTHSLWTLIRRVYRGWIVAWCVLLALCVAGLLWKPASWPLYPMFISVFSAVAWFWRWRLLAFAETLFGLNQPVAPHFYHRLRHPHPQSVADPAIQAWYVVAQQHLEESTRRVTFAVVALIFSALGALLGIVNSTSHRRILEIEVTWYVFAISIGWFFSTYRRIEQTHTFAP